MVRWASKFSSGLLLLLVSCSAVEVVTSAPMVSESPQVTTADAVLWRGEFSATDWIETWGAQESGAWGLENLEVRPLSEGPFSEVLRVYYPAGSASPSVSRSQGGGLGGWAVLCRLEPTSPNGPAAELCSALFGRL